MTQLLSRFVNKPAESLIQRAPVEASVAVHTVLGSAIVLSSIVDFRHAAHVVQHAFKGCNDLLSVADRIWEIPDIEFAGLMLNLSVLTGLIAGTILFFVQIMRLRHRRRSTALVPVEAAETFTWEQVQAHAKAEVMKERRRGQTRARKLVQQAVSEAEARIKAEVDQRLLTLLSAVIDSSAISRWQASGPNHAPNGNAMAVPAAVAESTEAATGYELESRAPEGGETSADILIFPLCDELKAQRRARERLTDLLDANAFASTGTWSRH